MVLYNSLQTSFRDIIGGKIYGVSELNAEIGAAVRDGVGSGFIWVEGEITDFKSGYESGHWYFSLRDEKSSVRAVCWRSSAVKIGFVPENGMMALCRCQAGFYEKRGDMQINVRHIEPKGAGAEAVALRQLLAKLEAEGLFASGRKKPLPFLSRKIGVVTSPAGAALADIAEVIGGRFPNAEITVSPARVQGDSAPEEIVRALERLCCRDIDLIIVARGGGSGEDLSAFNTEIVARAVASCAVPVISAVGHETDVTASDLAADVRAATPSAAAEKAVPVKSDIIARLDEARARLGSALSEAAAFTAMEVDAASETLTRAMRSRLDAARSEFSARAVRLDSLSPLKTLGRGYSVAYTATGKPVTDSAVLKKGDELRLRFSKGEARVEVKNKRR